MQRTFFQMDDFKKYIQRIKLTTSGTDLWHSTEYAGEFKIEGKKVIATILKKYIPAGDLPLFSN